MSSKDRRRRVRVDQFKKQLAEEVIGEDSLVELEIGRGEFVTIYVPLDGDDTKDVGRKLREAGDDKEAGALVVLAGNPDVSAEDQLAKWLDSGNSLDDLIKIYMVEMRAAAERLGEFRYRG